MVRLENESPRQVREMIRRNELIRPTAGLCKGYVQANLAVVPKDLAYDFLLFCQRNPKPCPILDVTDAGSPEPRFLAPGADLRYAPGRRTCPSYRRKLQCADAVTIHPGEVPVFWACGVTPQAVAMAVKPELMITHSPGYMLIGDIRDESLAVF